MNSDHVCERILSPHHPDNHFFASQNHPYLDYRSVSSALQRRALPTAAINAYTLPSWLALCALASQHPVRRAPVPHVGSLRITVAEAQKQGDDPLAYVRHLEAVRAQCTGCATPTMPMPTMAATKRDTREPCARTQSAIVRGRQLRRSVRGEPARAPITAAPTLSAAVRGYLPLRASTLTTNQHQHQHHHQHARQQQQSQHQQGQGLPSESASPLAAAALEDVTNSPLSWAATARRTVSLERGKPLRRRSEGFISSRLSVRVKTSTSTETFASSAVGASSCVSLTTAASAAGAVTPSFAHGSYYFPLDQEVPSPFHHHNSTYVSDTDLFAPHELPDLDAVFEKGPGSDFKNLSSTGGAQIVPPTSGSQPDFALVCAANTVLALVSAAPAAD